MRHSLEHLPFHRGAGSDAAAYATRIDTIRRPARPFAAIRRALGAIHRYRQVAGELDRLLGLPERIFGDIGLARDEVARIRRQLRLRDFLDDTGRAGRPGGPV